LRTATRRYTRFGTTDVCRPVPATTLAHGAGAAVQGQTASVRQSATVLSQSGTRNRCAPAHIRCSAAAAGRVCGTSIATVQCPAAAVGNVAAVFTLRLAGGWRATANVHGSTAATTRVGGASATAIECAAAAIRNGPAVCALGLTGGGDARFGTTNVRTTAATDLTVGAIAAVERTSATIGNRATVFPKRRTGRRRAPANICARFAAATRVWLSACPAVEDATTSVRYGTTICSRCRACRWGASAYVGGSATATGFGIGAFSTVDRGGTSIRDRPAILTDRIAGRGCARTGTAGIGGTVTATILATRTFSAGYGATAAIWDRPTGLAKRSTGCVAASADIGGSATSTLLEPGADSAFQRAAATIGYLPTIIAKRSTCGWGTGATVGRAYPSVIVWAVRSDVDGQWPARTAYAAGTVHAADQTAFAIDLVGAGFVQHEYQIVR